jgi:hypothetical protein
MAIGWDRMAMARGQVGCKVKMDADNARARVVDGLAPSSSYLGMRTWPMLTHQRAVGER